MLNAVRAWILLSTLLVSTGWILSALHQLNRAGYMVVFVLAAAWLGIKKVRCPSRGQMARTFHKWLRRFQHPAPGLFLLLAILALTAGLLYVPANWDSDVYRTPRVLHWLAAGGWHWIRAPDFRFNVVGCGFEWLTAPLVLFTRTDRSFFLINWISFLLLPGLIFSVFTRLGTRPRVAWWWMWFLAAGWCFVMEASGVENDSFAAIYALAAVDLALRGRETGRVTDLWLSLLATALLTGSKQTNIPLALPGLIAVLPGIRLLLARPGLTLLVLAVGALVSILPITIFNLEHCGQCLPLNASTAFNAEKNYHLNPLWGIVGNSFYLPLQNLLPPVFPYAEQWNRLMDRFVQTPLGSHFTSFERFGCLTFGISENTAGIGLGVFILTMVSLGTVFWRQRSLSARVALGVAAGKASAKWHLLLVRLSPWLSLLVFMAKDGTYQNARQMAAYYALLYPLWLVWPGHTWLSRRRLWQRLGLLTMFASALLLVTDHSRPLFPAKTIIGWLQNQCPDSEFVQWTWRFVSQPTIESRRNCFDRDLPPVAIIGYASIYDAMEPGLWLPWEKHRVVEVLMGDTPQQLRSSGIAYVVVESSFLRLSGKTIDQWVAEYHGALVDQTSYAQGLGTRTSHLYLVYLLPEPEAGK